MDSLNKLNIEIEKIKNQNDLDSDLKINLIASDIKHWCEEYLKIFQNIEETSISNSHEIERKEKLINHILNK